MTMTVGKYLKRIAYDGPLGTDLATLRALHQAHLRAIPYENLDVQLGNPVTIAVPAIYEKIVERGRGGWCFEMNGLFGWALGELGFSVTRSAAGVMREALGQNAVGNHLVLKVELDEGLYMGDVGFGDGPLEPIRITEGAFLSQGFTFNLSLIEGGWWRLRNHEGGGAASFDFDLAPADESLLETKCAWLQTAPQSLFVQNAVVQRHVEDGLWILRGRVLRHLRPADRTDYLIADEGEYRDALRRFFDLDLPEATQLWPKICARHDVTLAEQAAKAAAKPA
ncbi:MAG: arylamine N-acetyltransferase [Alphaproteobacteria bacterium]|nr:arylamine N-acetyltransferase [Alphaproteobacteria bacterium]